MSSFPVSPGVYVTESSVDTIVPSIDTAIGGIAGVFRWGPVGVKTLVDSEEGYAERFAPPSDFNGETWFTGASFLNYSSSLVVVRAGNTTSANIATCLRNSWASQPTANGLLCVVKNEQDYFSKEGTFPAGVTYISRYPGSLGNSLSITSCDTSASFKSTISLPQYNANLTMAVGSSQAIISLTASSNAEAHTFANTISGRIAVTDQVVIGNTSVGVTMFQVGSVQYDLANTFYLSGNSTFGQAKVVLNMTTRSAHKANVVMTENVVRRWRFWDLMDTAPGQSKYVTLNGNTAARDEMHIVIYDRLGKFSGVPGTVLEAYKGVSRATDAKDENNLTNYYKDVINSRSKYVWWANDRNGSASANAAMVASSTSTEPYIANLMNGSDGLGEANTAVSDILNGYDAFIDDTGVTDVALIMAGKARGGAQGEHIANYIMDNICEVRKDCVAFISPPIGAVVNNADQEADAIELFRSGNEDAGINGLSPSSYGFLDSGYKQVYDKYNDKFRWIPLNGDTAGLAARTEATNDAWWSPAGFNRGNIKNIVRLAWNPRKTYRDQLYKAGINPVVQFEGLGTVLYGDKTLLVKPGSFDRINVRRLFIILEKAISTAAKFSLFEFNDEFTRAQFRNMVVPYLRDIKAKRGIQDFIVVCDSTNNPGSVIDRNQFVGHIYIKPAKSVNYIQLNFVAVGSELSFTDVIGRV